MYLVSKGFSKYKKYGGDNMDAETARAINALSKKVNDLTRRLDSYLGSRCDQNAEEISLADDGIMDIANVVSSHEEAITELAAIVSELSTK